MTAYQSGIAKFEASGAKVFGVSTDNTPSQQAFSKQVNASFLMLSDFLDRHVSKAYGVLMEQNGMANRATFVVDLDGKITHIEEGSAAIDPTGADTACSRLAHKQQ
jgi:peroxiredoxin